MRTEDEIKIKINETLYTAMVDECGAGPLCGDLVVCSRHLRS